ncbi:hypothetical protein [Marinicella sp. W31]|uniref:hypothetical protein n=1 Tax=Marinicella sp. W31 TaxID=3023713 RepID=UPI003756FEEF
MKKIAVILFLMVLLEGLHAEEKTEVMVESHLLYLPKSENEALKKIANFKVWADSMSEFHSGKFGKFDNTQPGGIWDLEVSMNDAQQFNILFYKGDKSKPIINENIDVSSLQASSRVLYEFEEGRLSLNIVPKIQQGIPDEIPLTVDNFGLDHMCFNNSAVILDDSFYMGKFSGFGERLKVGFPELNNIDLSMKPLNDWKPIGTYHKGTIRIGLDDNHLLTLLRVGLGPSGYENGGPFTVYGKITPSTASKEDILESSISYLKWQYSDAPWNKYLDTLIEAKRLNPYVDRSAGTIASNYHPSPQLIDAIGHITLGPKCGDMR